MSFEASWLGARERVDHTSRSADLAARFAAALGPAPRLVELGTGTGSNLRYLAPRLARPQHWRCLDHDPALLATASGALRAWTERQGWGWHGPCHGGVAGEPTLAPPADQRLIMQAPFGTIEAELVAADLAHDPLDPSLGDGAAASAAPAVTAVTASALLDLTSAAWLQRLATTCRRLPLLCALNFDGRLRWLPQHLDDQSISSRFVAHQGTDKGFGPALGPEAADHLAAELRGRDMAVTLERSDWRLGPADGPLLQTTLEGIIAAAGEIERDQRLERWARQRLAQLAAGELRLDVGHVDLLALPG